jgi:hypothetical protein
MAQVWEATDSRSAEETVVLDAVVIALLPEFRQVKARSNAGHLLAITESTRGVHLASLREGQLLRCTVTRRLPRVLRAELLADA